MTHTPPIPCVACGTTAARVMGPEAPRIPEDPDELAFRLEECAGCRLVRISFLSSPEELEGYVRKFHDMLYEKIPTKDLGKALKLFGYRADRFADLSPGSLLDVGSERGYFLRAMKDRGWQVTGIEPLREFADHARTEFGVEVHETTLETFRPGRTYDLVTLWHVLEHLEDPVAGLGRCRDLLLPSGVLQFEVPNVDSLGASLGGKFWMGFRDPTHRWFYRDRPLRLMAEKAGLEVIRITSGYNPAGWYSLKRALYGRCHGREHWRAARAGVPDTTGILPRIAYRLLSFYPFMRLLGIAGAGTGRGEALNVWCRRKP